MVDLSSHIFDIDSSDDDQAGPSVRAVGAAASTSKARLPGTRISSDLIILSDPEEDGNPAPKRQRTRQSPPNESRRPLSDTSKLSQTRPSPALQALSSPLAPSSSSVLDEIGEWSCPTCTYLNTPISLQCEVCLWQKPVKLGHEKGWTCLFCGEKGLDDAFWSCRSCGWVKTSS